MISKSQIVELMYDSAYFDECQVLCLEVLLSFCVSLAGDLGDLGHLEIFAMESVNMY